MPEFPPTIQIGNSTATLEDRDKASGVAVYRLSYDFTLHMVRFHEDEIRCAVLRQGSEILIVTLSDLDLAYDLGPELASVIPGMRAEVEDRLQGLNALEKHALSWVHLKD